MNVLTGSKLVEMCADGSAVNMWVCPGATKQLKSVATEVDYFKTLENTLVEL